MKLISALALGLLTVASATMSGSVPPAFAADAQDDPVRVSGTVFLPDSTWELYDRNQNQVRILETSIDADGNVTAQTSQMYMYQKIRDDMGASKEKHIRPFGYLKVNGTLCEINFKNRALLSPDGEKIAGLKYYNNWKPNVGAGISTQLTPKMVLIGEGGYSGKLTMAFNIIKLDIGDLEFFPDDAFSYQPMQQVADGAETPIPEIKLPNGEQLAATEYTVECNRSTADPNIVHVVFEAVPDSMVSGTRTLSYEIGSGEPQAVTGGTDISGAQVEAIADQLYTGSDITPAPKIVLDGKVLANGTDYSLSYSANRAIGTAKIVAAGRGNYSGTREMTFRITAIPMSKATVANPGSLYTSSLSKVTPKAAVTYAGKALKKGTDYTISYKNNRNPGTAQMIITGKGAFTGSQAIKFKLVNLGDELARTACELSYTKPAAYKGGLSGWKRGKKYKGSAEYLSAYRKYRDAYRKTDRSFRYCAQYCSTGIGVIVCASGYNPAFPIGYWDQHSYLGYATAKVGSTHKGWTCVAEYDKGKIPYGKLQPGDILTDKSSHIWMYVGSKIPREVYKQKGGTKGTDADLGKPAKDSVWMSAHGGWWHHPGSGSACAPCLGDTDYAYAASFNDVKVFRCTKPSDSSMRSGKPVKG